ncbi:hypothetical protein [Lysinibacillus fusiformis]|uniref:hypothetical protein n=1 Tax=Lysinibacillus fusiformis TaxID=28031 RepID=UPI00215A0E6B|nr:hypothetical protein [Lysinibacillus fusiformis]MCR8852372.1 hypothetical protein [Lysinibacillus fusiformis]WKT78853.1 hypothetical protein QYY55_08575 [Lysinibacillus fusiformis]
MKYMLRRLTAYEKEVGKEDGYSNFFVSGPFFTIGPFLIEGSLRFPHRRNEILPVRHILVQESNHNSCFYVSIPKSDSSRDQILKPYRVRRRCISIFCREFWISFE